MITIDTEAYRTKKVGSENHDFRCAVAAFDTLDVNGKPDGQTQWLETESSADLWYFIAEYTSSVHRTVLFAHNVAYDLRLSHGLKHLPTLGYQCTAISLTSYSCWARFRSGTKSLWVCDSLSFVPASIEKIGAAMGVEKLPMPEDGEGNESWFHRCRVDVSVTRLAMLRVLSYLKANDLGDFRLTGSAQASAAYRHRFLPNKTLLVHDDIEALTAERKAAWSGRAEVWTHGEVSSVVYEMDYQYAYAHLAYSNAVPVKLLSEHGAIPLHRFWNVADNYSVLAQVEISTNVPVVPTEVDKSIIWPVGSFTTTLWDHELRLAQREGAEIKILRYWNYRSAPILREWANWILTTLELPSNKLDPVIRFMLKDWSRALIGRFGLRYSVLEEIGNIPQHDLKLFGVYDIDENEQLEYLQMGSQLFERMAKVESPNSTPAVMSSIMSAARVRLWDAINVAGFETVLYVDTDGVIVTRAGYDRIKRAMARGALSGLRLKAKYQGGCFRSPRNIDLGEMRRVSGAPRKAERLAPGIYRGEIWQSLPSALKQRGLANVFVHERTFNVSETDKRRVHLADGRTEPHRLALPA